MIPAELLSAYGLDASLRERLQATQRLSAPQIECLEHGFALYLLQAKRLHEDAPTLWPAPRPVNVLVVSDAQRVLPYLEPFVGTSLMLYVSDLDTHPQYVAYLFAHTERLALTRSVGAALQANVGWWSALERDARSAFARAARQAKRPDARVFVLLAQAFEWISAWPHHAQRLQPSLDTLIQRAQAAFSQALAAHPLMRLRASTNTSTPTRPDVQALCAWLSDTRAQVAIAGPGQERLWSPQHGDTSAVHTALCASTPEGLTSLWDDLRCVDAHSRAFLSAVRTPTQLPRHYDVLETGGGVYLDAAAQVVVYELQQPNFDPRLVPAPPYHRLLLSARVMHEWGHLAHAAGLIQVPEARQADYRAARTALGETFVHALRSAPAALQPVIEARLQTLARALNTSPSAALARKTLARVGDYLANRLAARLLGPEPMQAYVRVNVRPHTNEALELISALARYAYEIHYLPLAGLAREYFYATSRFRQEVLDRYGLEPEAVEHLFDAVGRVLDCYALDETRLDLRVH